MGKEGRVAWKRQTEILEKRTQEESEKRCKLEEENGLVVNCCQQNMLREKNMLLRKNWLVQIGIHVNI